ncbi:hypothetical protein HanRHA438_Chr08g0342391 [Helianthus annuus]|nr:hypothetical protein HanRHA438_Chr08g0342391 [Helianthus annuus]
MYVLCSLFPFLECEPYILIIYFKLNYIFKLYSCSRLMMTLDKNVLVPSSLHLSMHFEQDIN